MSELQQQLGRVEKRAKLYEALAREITDFLGRVEIPDNIRSELTEWNITLAEIGVQTPQTRFHRSPWTPDPTNEKVAESEDTFDGITGQVPIMSNGQKISEAVFGDNNDGESS